VLDIDTNWNQNLVGQTRVFILQFMYRLVGHWVDPIKSASLPNWGCFFIYRMKAMHTDRQLTNMQDVQCIKLTVGNLSCIGCISANQNIVQMRNNRKNNSSSLNKILV